MTTTPTMPPTDQPAFADDSHSTGQFRTTPPFPHRAPSTYPPPTLYPDGVRSGSVPAGFVAAPSATVPPTPSPRRRTGWLIAGCTLLAVAALQLTRLPEWLAYDEHGLIGNLTGVVALVGIGIALIVTGWERRR